jgi:hypothetical protein
MDKVQKHDYFKCKVVVRTMTFRPHVQRFSLSHVLQVQSIQASSRQQLLLATNPLYVITLMAVAYFTKFPIKFSTIFQVLLTEEFGIF